MEKISRRAINKAREAVGIIKGKTGRKAKTGGA